MVNKKLKIRRLAGQVVKLSKSDRIRFWCKVGISHDGCWRWMGRLNGGGRGRFMAQGIQDYAYRWVAVLYGVDLQKGDVVDHLCNNPACVNPKHLQVTNHAGNMKAMAIRQRGPSKLTRSQVDEIRRRRRAADRPTQRALAKEFGVDQSTISLIENGKTWDW